MGGRMNTPIYTKFYLMKGFVTFLFTSAAKYIDTSDVLAVFAGGLCV